MTNKDLIRLSLNNSSFVVKMLLDDLSDADILVRPVPGANHIAWQLGQLLTFEASVPQNVPGAKSVELPAGFADQYTKETAASESTKGFLTKAEYLALYDRVRQATLAALDKATDADLNKPLEGPMASMMPHVAGLFLMIASHDMMHTGQFSVVRRKLGKPVKF